ncbi:MAG: PHP domain-containing protein [Fibromonadaceae bacterium]|jgi:predicted metal-dependent phosphoesterase TrpH|nr:PHP domain-containing protein [Fibromonadaceae bacterium]
MKNIDLHMHTLHSDGLLSVEELLLLASRCNLSCISITDHDTFAAYSTAPKIAESLEVELVPGIEISSMHNERDVHILGYFCDTQNADLLAALAVQHETRKWRVKASLEKLSKLGIEVSYEQVDWYCTGVSIGRPHIARAMLEVGAVSSFNEAFDRYLKDGAPAYTPMTGFSPEKVISLIRNAGGVAVMAHPEYTNADYLIPKLVEYGIKGIEVYNYKTTKNINKYELIARKHGLIKTGGSDFHYEGNPLFGTQNLPYSIVEDLRASILSS